MLFFWEREQVRCGKSASINYVDRQGREKENSAEKRHSPGARFAPKRVEALIY